MTKIGLVGLGIGRELLRVVRECGNTTVAAVCDTNASKARRVSDEDAGIQTYTDLDDMLATDIDAVVIATPIQFHGPQAIAAIRAGKHVLCQYIAAADEREAEGLLRACHESGVTYMLIETDCHERQNVAMMQLARRGVLGDLTTGRGHYIHDCRSMGRNPDGSLTWRGELWMESPGGRCNAVHTAMPLLEVFGERVTEVYSRGPGSRTMPKHTKHDRVTTVGRLPSDRIVEFVDDMFSWRPPVCGYCLQGTRGCFEFDRAAIVEDDGLSAWKDLKTLEAQYGLGLPAAGSGGHDDAWSVCVSAFLDAIERGASPPQDLPDALHVTAIGWAANESLRSGLPARVVQYD